ncbi:helix-turn-helix domain-containing protein [Paenibacillus thalictri]|nr:helix-turn-helix domain-containing protein [Paenibacillus thalictri]
MKEGTFIFQKGSMFRRLFVSYMLITFIPIAVLFGILYKNSVVNLRSEVESFSISNMYKIKDLMDTRIREWKSISSLISLNPKLSPYNMTNQDYQTMEGIAELAKYKAGNAFISDILLWYKNDEDRLFSSTGTISLPVLLEKSYGFNEAERMQFERDIRNMKVPVLKSFPASDTMTYMVPLPVFGLSQHGTAIFMFKGSVIRKMISEGRTEFQGATLLLDANLNEMVKVDTNGMLEQEGMLAFLKEKVVPGIHVVDFKHNSLSMISVVSEETGWTYVTVIPTRQFQAVVTSQEIFVIACTLILLVLCSAVALTLALGNYRPIRKLDTFVRQHRLTSDAAKGNELENISQAIGKALALNQSLTDQLDTQRMLLRYDVLIRLLKGDSSSRDEQIKLLESSGLSSTGPYYAVILVCYDPTEGELAKLNGKVLDYVADHYSADGKAFAVEPGSDNAVAIIACAKAKGDYGELQHLAEQILELYGESRGKVTIGIGKIGDELLQINRSYIEAYAAVEHRSVLCDRPIIRFEEIVTFPQWYWQSAEDEMYWLHSLKQGDRAQALEALRKMVGHIEDKNMPEAMTRFACNKIADLAIQAVQQVTRESAPGRNEAPQFGEAIIHVIQFHSLPEFRRHMQTLIGSICDYVYKVQQQREQGLVAHIIRYMEDNFKDPNLSLESIAEQFGNSNYYWSRFFKEKIGCHFTDYLWNLRVREAKRQFAASNKTLKDVVADIGYLDLSSFSRRFKGEEGITPGQYRKLYATANET